MVTLQMSRSSELVARWRRVATVAAMSLSSQPFIRLRIVETNVLAALALRNLPRVSVSPNALGSPASGTRKLRVVE